MRKALNKFLENRGYRLEKITRFSVLLDRLWRKVPDFKFVQVGANDGISFDGLYPFVTSHSCSGLVIEPLPDVFETLRLNYLHYPKIIPLNVALHPHRSTATLYRVASDKIGSLQKPWLAGTASFSLDHTCKFGLPPEFIVEEQVPCVPLMNVLLEYGALSAHLLQIDTEGYDAEIVKMIDFTRFRPALIKYESAHLNPMVQAETQDLLIRNGYEIIQEGANTVACLLHLN